jgi:hypothetical protein
MKRVFDYDPFTGVTEIFHYDHLTGDAHIETHQDVGAALDNNKALANDDEYTKKGIKNEMWHYAFIPIVVQLQWLKKYGAENDPMRKGNEKLLFSLLNDREWRHLKTTNKIHTARS